MLNRYHGRYVNTGDPAATGRTLEAGAYPLRRRWREVSELSTSRSAR